MREPVSARQQPCRLRRKTLWHAGLQEKEWHARGSGMASGLVVGGTGGNEFEVEVFDQGEDFGGDGGGEIELFHIFVVLFSGAKI